MFEGEEDKSQKKKTTLEEIRGVIGEFATEKPVTYCLDLPL